MVRPRFYTDEVIEKIRILQQQNVSTSKIAEQLGTTPARLQSRLHQLGLGKKALGLDVGKFKVRGSVVVQVPGDVIAKFAAPAALRGLRPPQLIRLVLARIADENLFTAILDDGV